MKAEIMGIGTELLMGELTDTNSSWIASRLPALGIVEPILGHLVDEEQAQHLDDLVLVFFLYLNQPPTRLEDAFQTGLRSYAPGAQWDSHPRPWGVARTAHGGCRAPGASPCPWRRGRDVARPQPSGVREVAVIGPG